MARATSNLWISYANWPVGDVGMCHLEIAIQQQGQPRPASPILSFGQHRLMRGCIVTKAELCCVMSLIHASVISVRRKMLYASARMHASDQSQAFSWLSLTHFRTRFRNSFGSFLHSLPASMLAGLSSFGLLNMLITLSSIVSGVCTGDHRSEAIS